MWRRRDGEGHHFGCGRHFEIQPGLHELPQQAHIPILDMAPVLAQVDGDAVGAGLLGDQGRLHRIGIRRTSRLTQGRHVIDVHAQSGEQGRCTHGMSNLWLRWGWVGCAVHRLPEGAGAQRRGAQLLGDQRAKQAIDRCPAVGRDDQRLDLQHQQGRPLTSQGPRPGPMMGRGSA